MVLEVPVPDPPSLSDPQQHGEYEAIDMTDQEIEDDYRHEELEQFLQAGAWQDAFEQWAAEADVTAEAFQTLVEGEVLDRFDFYWDPQTDDAGYRAPALTPDERRAVDDPDVVELELDTLGRIVTEFLENDYLLRDDDSFGFFAEEYTGEEPEEQEP